MPAIAIKLTLTCTTPPSVGSGGTHGTLADKVVTRNARGQFVIPASQVKGKLRHACEQLLRPQGVPLCHPPQAAEMCPHATEIVEPPCLLCQIFGSPAERSRLCFHDLTAIQPNLPHETIRSMVSLNRRRRTAEAQRLFLVETAPHFQGLQFQSPEAIIGSIRDPRHVHVLLAGLKMLYAWGGGASRGLGWGQLEVEAWLEGESVKFKAEKVKQLCPY